METILITGASGFIGKRFCEISDLSYNLREVSLRQTKISEIDFSGIDVILHLAAIAHQHGISDSQFFAVNYGLTKQLAIKAVESGVKQFVFMSSTRVFGEEYEHLTLKTECKPLDAVGKSKLRAENFLKKMTSKDFTVSIIRAPLVYGPGVKGNMKKLVELMERRRILPLGGISNKRSMVAIDNLVALIHLIILKKSQGIFLVQDEQPLSTSELLSAMAQAKGVPLKLVPIPGILQRVIKVLKPEIYKRVFGSLVIDDSHTRNRLDFTPPISSLQGIDIMIKNI